MAYQPPDVRVEIQYEGFSAPDPNVSMPPMYLGPCFQKVSKAVGGNYEYHNGLNILSYPDLASGAIVDTRSVKLTLLHSGSGEEYDVTDGLGKVDVAIENFGVLMPAGIGHTMLGGATGERVGDYEFRTPSHDLARENILYGDLLRIVDYEISKTQAPPLYVKFPINEVDADTGNLRLVPQLPMPHPELKVAFTNAIPNAGRFFEDREIVTSNHPDTGSGVVDAVVYTSEADILIAYGSAVGQFEDGDKISWTDGAAVNPTYGEGTVVHSLITGLDTGYLWVARVYGDDLQNLDAISNITQGTGVHAAATADQTFTDGRGWSGYILLTSVTGTFGDGCDITGGSSGAVALETGKGVADPYLMYEIVRPMNGLVSVSYNAARGEYTDEPVWIGSLADLIAYAGSESQLTPDNPLVYAAKLALSVGTGCYLMNVQDLDGYVDPDAADLQKWLNAFEAIRWHDHAYAHVLLSQSDDVRAAFEVMMNWKRDPDNYLNEIIGMFSMPRRTRNEAIPLKTVGSGGGVSNNGMSFTDPGITDFNVFGCLPGRYLELVDDDGKGHPYRVNTVSASMITLLNPVEVEHRGLTRYRYVNEYYNTEREAAYYRQYGQSVQNCSMRICWPDVCMLEGMVVPSYYLYAIRAAQLSVDRPATIYTKAGVPYVERVLNAKFEPPQLKTIGEGGIEVFAQENPRMPVYSRDAITTDMTHPARMEQVVQSEIDYSARYIRAKFRPDQGRKFMDEWLEAGIAILAGGCDRHLVSETRTLQRLAILGWAVDADDPRYLDLDFDLYPRWPNRGARIVLHVRSRSK